MSNKFYDVDIWQEWCQEEEKNYVLTEYKGTKRKTYKKKGYLHFDPRFWFPEHKKDIEEILANEKVFSGWNFYPFIKNVILSHRFKKSTPSGRPERKIKERPICYAAHKDALIYGYCSYYLTKKYEQYIKDQGFSEVVYAYRTDLDSNCNIQFAKEVFDYIRSAGECTAIAIDITGFFDNLEHKYLKQNWSTVIGENSLPDQRFKIYKTLTQFAYINFTDLLNHLDVDIKKVHPYPNSLLDFFPEGEYSKEFRLLRKKKIIQVQKKVGVPQGAPMSAVLSNIYMIDFDAQISALAKSKNFMYRRYCDDVLIICPNNISSEIKQIVYSLVEQCSLTIQPEKEEEILFKYDSNKAIRAFDAKKLDRIGYEKNSKK